MSDKLKNLRNRIDALDQRLVKLLSARARLAQRIGTLKQGVVYRPEREAQVLRHVAQLHRAKLAVDAGASLDEATRSFQPAVHFRRKPLVETALRNWSAARLQQSMAQFAETELESRRRAPLADAIVERALLQTALTARKKEPQRG